MNNLFNVELFSFIHRQLNTEVNICKDPYT